VIEVASQRQCIGQDKGFIFRPRPHQDNGRRSPSLRRNRSIRFAPWVRN
jgi:hypothetical protein